MPKLKYRETNENILESKQITAAQLMYTTTDVTVASEEIKGTRKKLIIRSHIQTNSYGNVRINSYFMIFNDIVKKGVTAYLEDALTIYNNIK